MFLIMLGIFYVVNIMNVKVNTLTYNEFMTELSNKENAKRHYENTFNISKTEWKPKDENS